MGRRSLGVWAGCAVAAVLLLGADTAVGQEISEMEFRDAPIASILVALGRATGHSIVPDETVHGNASYYFTDTDFETALEAFAARFDLFVTHHDRIYTVSALSIEADSQGLLTVRAPSVPIATLLGRASRATGVPVLYERLPSRDVSYFAASVSLETMLEQLADHLPDHTLRRHEGAFLFAHREHQPRTPARPEWVSERDGRFTIASEHVPLDVLLTLLFTTAGREYQLLTRGQAMVPPLSFSDHPFDELLRLVLEQADAGFAVHDGTYYIVDTPPSAATARGLATRIIPVRNLPVGRLLDLLPSSQLAGVTLGHDREANVLSATGTPQSIARVSRLISELDSPRANVTTERLELGAIAPATLATLLPDELAPLRITPLPGGTAVLVSGAPEELAGLRRFLELADEARISATIELDHIGADELVALLPPGIDPASLRPTADPRRLVFTGTRTMRNRLGELIAAVDRPTPQVRYHVLVLQMQAGRADEFDIDLGNRLTTPDSRDAFLANLGNLLSLEFDVVSAFGYQFA
ncbi:MAG: secretin N-terminal domain-containing protein, partial [Spirochaetota bacterium]